MHIIPVIDVSQGKVVRAAGGKRADYRPLTSRLTDSTDPLQVARAIRDRHGWSEIYVADLDAVEGAPAALPLNDRLRADGFKLWVDAGLRSTHDAERLRRHADVLIVGLETWGDSESLSMLRGDDTAFSLDLRDGRPIGIWGTTNPMAIAERAIAAGMRRLIVLDLARVGGSDGIGTEPLVRALVQRHPDVPIFAGGGIRTSDDLRRLEDLGVAGALIASALHDDSL